MQYQDKNKIRGYFFGNMYLSPIQQGIQCAHVVTKMFSAYRPEYSGSKILYDWAENGPTKILLNGGYQSNLQTIHEIFNIICPRLQLPYMKFHEENSALNGALTSVGVIVPEEVYTPISVYDFFDTFNKSGLRGGDERMEVLNSPERILELLIINHKQYNVGDLINLLHATLKTARLA